MFKEIFLFSSSWFKKMKFLCIISWAMTLVYAATTGLAPREMGIAIDAINQGIINNTSVNFTPIWWALGYTSVSSLIIIAVIISRRAVYFKMYKNLQDSLYNRLLMLGNNFYQKNKTGDLVTIMTQDVDRISWFTYSFFFLFMEASLTMLVCVFFIMITSWEIALVLLVLVLIVALINMKLNHKFEDVYNVLQDNIAEVNDEIELTFAGISVVKSYQREYSRTLVFKDIMNKRAKSDYKAYRYNTFLWMSYVFLPVILTVVVIFMGGNLIFADKWTIGKLAAGLSYVFAIAGRILWAGQIIADYKWAKASYLRIKRILTAEPEILSISNNEHNLNFDKSIEISNLNFYYQLENSKKYIFKGIDMKIEKGAKIGILGEVGSGKSTLFSLLLRLLNTSDGSIKIDGNNIERLDITKYRKLFGYVPQEPMLFSDTIKENIKFGRENITDESINKAVEIAQFEKEIEKFPNKLDEIIGPNGLTLSGGQRQRLALARALVCCPQILLFDDTTSALDTKTENDLWEAVNTELNNITKIIVTHRISTVADADYIYVLENGFIKEEGRPIDLLKNGESYYSNLYNKQIFNMHIA